MEFLKGNSLYLNVEIKANTGFITGVEDRVVAMLREYHMEDRCIISSFNHFILKNIKKRYPDFQVGALYSITLDKDMAEYGAEWGCNALHADYHLVDQALVEKALRWEWPSTFGLSIKKRIPPGCWSWVWIALSPTTRLWHWLNEMLLKKRRESH